MAGEDAPWLVPPNLSDAYTINGQPGDLYNCSSDSTYKLKVQEGKTYMLRMVNAVLQKQSTNPYTTDTITIAPGQTMDVLLKADQPLGSYYMAASVYQGSDFVTFDDTTPTAIIEYDGAATTTTPIMPVLPDFSDNETAHRPDINQCQGINNTIVKQAEEYFNPSTNLSILEAYYYNVDGIYTTDFPDEPPIQFDYTSPDNQLNGALLTTSRGAKVRKFKYNSTVEIVFQNTALGTIENHPIHLHGYDFHILAQGFGNYDPTRDQQTFNLVNPQLRNTVAVPIGGWAVVRFRASNPGVWFMHCHLEVHVPWGLASVFIVENGPTPETSLIPPPPDFPEC
ncbi:hypothetical protein Leryth_002096 [Lithospermum erythrorhizon]|nr:hypothetical protein Leryth_002096 [Lithospermum erythrorhizon]